MTAAVRWRYRAADANGSDVSGEIDAPTERDAVDALRRRALWVTTLEPLAPRSSSGAPSANAASAAGGATSARVTGTMRESLSRLAGNSRSSELAVTIRAMATLLAAGVPLDRALAYAAGPATRADLRAAFIDVRERVRAGDALSAALSGHAVFPAVFAPTVAAGESSGALDAALSSLAEHLERAEAVSAKLRAALVYPALLGVASVVGIVVILLVVVPRFAALITDIGGALPWSTRALVAAGNAFSRWWWLLLLVVVGAVVAIRRWLAVPRNRLQWHQWQLGWPLLGRFGRSKAAASYTGVLALSLRAGVPLLSAMRLARGVVGNQALTSRLEEAEARVRSGGSVAAALDGILPPLSVRLLDAGEASGDLAGMASRAADAADAETQRMATGALAMVEPLLILGFGTLVGFVALALLQAIYGINARGV